MAMAYHQYNYKYKHTVLTHCCCPSPRPCQTPYLPSALHLQLLSHLSLCGPTEYYSQQTSPLFIPHPTQIHSQSSKSTQDTNLLGQTAAGMAAWEGQVRTQGEAHVSQHTCVINLGMQKAH